jgi:hypothetical protein
VSTTGTDYPRELAGAHGRIAAYRSVLAKAEAALADAVPYVYNVAHNPDNAPWRRETAEGILAEIIAARDTARAELAVTNP